jgi:hypothetical protein
VSQRKELMARAAYQQIKQGPFESLAQFIERFRETYQSYKNTLMSTNPVNIDEKEQAMDFFHALDAGRYGAFKTSMLNGWAAGAFDPPDTVNKIYRTTGSWVKPVPRGEGGTAVSYVTLEEGAKQAAAKKKQENQKKQRQAAAAAAPAGTGDDAEEKTPPKDRSNYRCWSCNKFGHLANLKQCPNYKKKLEEKEVNANATWQEYEASMYTTVRWVEEKDETREYTVNNAVHVTQVLAPTKVLLDNQAGISIIHLMLLNNVQKLEKRNRVKRVGGLQLIVDEEGILEGFFPVYASEKTKANVLSFADIEDLYNITYVQKRAFMVNMGGRDLVFNRREKLYVAGWGTENTGAATVQENEQLHMKEEVRRAKLAHEFIKNSGYPSLGEAVHLLTVGNMRNIPVLLPADVERAYNIYGPHPEYVRGQMVKKMATRVPVDHTLQYVDKNLKLYTDVMHIDYKMFLVSVVDPLNLTLQCKIERESRQDLGMGLQGQLAILQSRNFNPNIVYVNSQSAFRTTTQDFPGVEVDVGGAADYVSKVDAKIRRIKETYRKVKHGLPWKLS